MMPGMGQPDPAHVTVVLADGRVVYLSDRDARRLANDLWNVGAASVAVAIWNELRRRGPLRQTIEVARQGLPCGRAGG
jgi:hypothetical protein